MGNGESVIAPAAKTQGIEMDQREMPFRVGDGFTAKQAVGHPLGENYTSIHFEGRSSGMDNKSF